MPVSSDEINPSESPSSKVESVPNTKARTPPAMTPQQKNLSTSSSLKAYREFTFGDGSIVRWTAFELIQMLSGIPGLLGFGARAIAYPLLFNSCGAKPAFARGITLRRPEQIVLGSRVLMDEYSSLEVRGAAGRINLGDHVSIGRFSTLIAKDAGVTLSAGCNIGSYCRLATESGITIGESVLVGAYSYIGAGNHQKGSDGIPLIAQQMEHKGGVVIGANAWIGAGVMIMDGVTIGEKAIVGAQSLVMNDVPSGATVVGSPARIVASEAR